ncbi:nucleotidyl transferase AbiEii/AbiGii toxin family protein [Patescibacteria group bacterium]|nr:nucleotidyl transferase AbiEii/AbiGii toxin family protein [Patescibacteria group bacterium]MBU4023444.1 nucleotidyl transferase AbiEii/AbiGii toxin family protein [Patescibacteria group bacterium]MBU4078058.1 nucleotidyl transferase AbiEii/AbiGii toxin family protein [Patescibacteria group bacterium]
MTLNTATHKNILIKILKNIYTDSSIGPFLGFKGGTAAHLFYDLDRFSIDLDFDLLDEKKEQEVFDKVESIVKEYGTIKEKTNKRHTLFILLSYNEEAQNIKVEINKRSFGSQYEVKNYLGISMLAIKKEDMFAHKLVAMTERIKTANRDVFDVHFFLKNDWEINREIVEKRTEMKFVDYLKKCIKFIENMPDRGILSGMGELIEEKQKTWVKSNLKQDTVFLLKLMLDNEKE